MAVGVDGKIEIICGRDNTTQVNVCKQFSMIHIRLPVCSMKDLYQSRISSSLKFAIKGI